MSLVVQPQRPSEDDLDGQLRAFFRAEMPHPWPEWKAPTTPSRPPAHLPAARGPIPANGSLWRSRLGLAASVALLVLGSLFLQGKLSYQPPTLGDGVPTGASRDDLPTAKELREKGRLWLEQPADGPTEMKVIIER